MARRMTMDFDSLNTGRDLVPAFRNVALSASGTTLSRNSAEYFSRSPVCLPAGDQKSYSRCADRVARVRKQRLAVLVQPANVIGVTVRQDYEVEVSRFEPCRFKLRREPAAGWSRHEPAEPLPVSNR